MKWSRLLVGLFVAVLVIFVLVVLEPFPTQTQVTEEDASVKSFGDDETQILFLTLGQAELFFLIVVAVVGGIASLGGGIGFLVFLANRNVARSQAKEAVSTNPLEYRTYGMAGAIALPVMLAGLMVFILVVMGVLPEQAATQAESVDLLFTIEFVVMSIIFGLVVGLFLHALFYFRAKEGDFSDGEFFHGNTTLEVVWTFIPAVIVMALGVYTVFVFGDVMEEKDNEVAVKVAGQQWVWQFEYPVASIPDDIRRQLPADLFIKRDANGNPELDAEGNPLPLESFTDSDLYMLIDQPVVFEMQSRDVIHSFWIPEMRIKQDVVPGVTTKIRYTPNLEGEYQVRCTEMCGLLHSAMLARVFVVSESAYIDWVTSSLQALGNPILAGENIYQSNCQSCHTLNGARGTGPSWLNIYNEPVELANGQTVSGDRDYIVNSIINPNSQIVAGFNANVMPQNYGSTLSDVQLDQIVCFIIAISDDGNYNTELEGLATGTFSCDPNAVLTQSEAAPAGE